MGITDTTNAPSSRPQRQRVSRIDKLAKDSEIIGGDLMRAMEKSQGQKRKPDNTIDPGLFNIPEDAPLNRMAPAAKKQRISLPSQVRFLSRLRFLEDPLNSRCRRIPLHPVMVVPWVPRSSTHFPRLLQRLRSLRLLHCKDL